MTEIIHLIQENRRIGLFVVIELTITFMILNIILESTTVTVASFERFEMHSEMPLYTIYDEFNNEHEFFQDPSAVNRINAYHDEMISNEAFSYMDIIMQPINLVDTEVNNPSFYYVPQNPSLIKSIQVNSAFFDNFQISANEGRPFETNDYVFNSKSIPAILGYNYHSLFKIGEIYSIAYLGIRFDMKIIGYLPENTTFIHQGTVLSIDNYIMLPVRTFLNEPEKGTAEFDHHIMLSMQKLGGTVLLDSHDSLPSFIRIMNTKLKKHGIFMLGILKIPNTAIEVLNTLAGRYSKIYLYVSTLFLLLSITCIVTLLRHIIRENNRTFGILMLCGAKHNTIAIYLLGIVAFLFACSHIAAYVLSKILLADIPYNKDMVIWNALLIMVLFIPVCIVMVRRSINDLIRRSDL